MYFRTNLKQITVIPMMRIMLQQQAKSALEFLSKQDLYHQGNDVNLYFQCKSDTESALLAKNINSLLEIINCTEVIAQSAADKQVFIGADAESVSWQKLRLTIFLRMMAIKAYNKTEEAIKSGEEVCSIWCDPLYGDTKLDIDFIRYGFTEFALKPNVVHNPKNGKFRISFVGEQELANVIERLAPCTKIGIGRH